MPWKPVTIEQPFTPSTLLILLQEGHRGSMSRYTHYDIVDWAHRYSRELSAQRPFPEELRPVWQVADDITLQWELYISSHYSIEEMKRFSSVDILLPRPLFATWLQILEQPGPG